jgi:RHS repeat-associated protein
MPGDEISVSAYAKYMNLTETANTNSFLTALGAAFGVSSSSIGKELKLYNSLDDFAGSVPAGNHPADDDGVPKAFVTILLFDNNYNLLDATWDQITATGAQTSPSVKQPPHDLLSATYKVKEAGFAYIFLSNEHPKFVDVYFDDVTVTHTPSQIVSVSDYYPFGLAFNSSGRENTARNQYLYAGKELQDELEIQWADFGARMYLSDIGRWNSPDFLAEKFRRWSPYNYALNNPIRVIDPDGMDATSFLGSDIAWGRATSMTLGDDLAKKVQAAQPAAKVFIQILGELNPGEKEKYQAGADALQKKWDAEKLNVKVIVRWGKAVLSKKQFNTGNFGERNGYLVVGEYAELFYAKIDLETAGWKDFEIDPSKNITNEIEKISSINKTSVRDRQEITTPDGYADGYDGYGPQWAPERMADLYRHEHGHQFYSMRHFPETVMAEGVPIKKFNIYNDDMLKRLKMWFGLKNSDKLDR